MTISDVYREYVEEGMTKREAAVMCLGIQTGGFFDAIEEPRRTEAIDYFINKYKEKK